MRNAVSAAVVPALCASMSAVHVVNLLDPRLGASTTTTTVSALAPPLHSGVPDLLLLASAAGVSVSVGVIYCHLHRGAGNRRNRRRLPEIVSFMLCVCASVLQFLLFARTPAPGGADVDHGAQARALGLAALHVLPAAATVTFSLATMLIVAGHIRAGGEGGGGAVAVAVAGEEPIQAPVGVVGLRLLSRMVLASAAGLVSLMALAVYGAYY